MIKTKKIIFGIGILFVTLLSISSFMLFKYWQKNNSPKEKFQNSKYISGHTNGIISNKSDIIIVLNEPIHALKKDLNLFKFSPNIEGKCELRNDRTIIFKPNETLPSDTKFKAKVYLNKIKNFKNKNNVFEFEFQTKKQAISFQTKQMALYNNHDLSRQKIIGELSTNDFVPIKKVEQILNAVQNNNSLPITWEHYTNKHIFVIENIKRSNKEEKVILTWSGQKIGCNDKGKKEIIIPSLMDFKVIEYLNDADKKTLTIQFSDPIDKDQDIEGLIYLKETKTKISIKDNLVTLYDFEYPKNNLTLIINENLKNVGGYKIGTNTEYNITFANLKPQIKLIDKGNIVPNVNNGLNIPFKAVNLNGVIVKIIKIYQNNILPYYQKTFNSDNEIKRFGRIVYSNKISLSDKKPIILNKWQTYDIDLSKLIKIEAGALYRVYILFNKQQSIYPCKCNKKENHQIKDITKKNKNDFDDPEGSFWFDGVDKDYSLWDYEERDNPCHDTYYMDEDRFIAKNILASNLGIIAKKSDNKELFVAISNLNNTNFEKNVDITLYNLQNQVINKDKTDEFGIAKLDLKNQTPFLLVAKKGTDVGYLKLNESNSLSLSPFDVGGIDIVKGIKGFIYAERGVWRPGDKIYLTFILEDKDKILPKNHPIIFELYNPHNQIFETRILKNADNSFSSIEIKTNYDSPTGNWLAKFKIGNSVFHKNLRIETIKPNRLDAEIDIDQDSLNKKHIKGTISAKWLLGYPAKNLKTDISASFTNTKTYFKEYASFDFDDPSKTFNFFRKMIFEGNLNEFGKAKIDTDLDIDNTEIPGKIKMLLFTRVFEQTGDFSQIIKTFIISPFEAYVGIKIPKGKGYNNALMSDKINLIPIVTVDSNGIPISNRRLKIEVFELEWKWWFEIENGENLAKYIGRNNSKLIKTDLITTKDANTLYELNLNMQSWGRKFIKITDQESGHSTGKIFYTDYEGYYNSDGVEDNLAAEILQFKTNKEKYLIGENIEISLPRTNIGKALISIEKGNKILKYFWVDLTKQNELKFVTTKEMTPNIYVNITFIQPHTKNNDLPLRLYGIKSIKIKDPSIHLNPILDIKDEFKPNQQIKIKVSEKNNRPMTYTLAMVDMGLLNLTNYKLVNPVNYFYSKEALKIKTWDMYKYVVGAFKGEMHGLISLGGGDMEKDILMSKNDNANRFKPFVKFIGPIKLLAGKTNTHHVDIPNYIGSVKTMVIAGNDGAYGIDSKTSLVKQPLMVLATVPRTVCPMEKISIPITVFSFDDKIKEANVTIETNEFFNVKDKNKHKIKFDDEKQKNTTFNLEVTKKVGVGKIKVIVVSRNEKASYEVELNVKLPNPKISKIVERVIEPDNQIDLNYELFGVKGTNKVSLELSKLSPLKLQNRLNYLIEYPHGCSEQITSAIFAQLFLNDLTFLSQEKYLEVQNNINEGINKLKNYQNSSGGFSYWPNYNDEENEWCTNYIGHFLIEAKKQGYTVPDYMLNNWVKYQKRRANEWHNVNSKEENSFINSNQRIQAYRLYTLALFSKPEIGAMNRMKAIGNLDITAKWLLVGAYYLIGRNDIANKLIIDLSTEIGEYNELSYSYGNNVRDKAIILEVLTIMDEKIKAAKIYKFLSQTLNSEKWLNTQTIAFALTSIAKFIKGELTEEGINAKIDSNLVKNKNLDVKQDTINIELPTINQSEILKIKNNGKTKLYITLNNSGIPLQTSLLDKNNDLNLEINYFNLENETIDPKIIKQGTDFYIEVVVHHPGIREDYKEMALTQILPSGWEIVRTYVEEKNSFNDYDYQDIRDDRVLTYFSLKRNEKKVFTLKVNAAYLGEYYLPLINCEAMYDATINATKSGGRVKIIK